MNYENISLKNIFEGDDKKFHILNSKFPKN